MKAQPGARSEPRDPEPRTGDSQVRERTRGASPRHLARIVGGLYLIIIVGGFFAIGFVSAALVVPGDAAATAHNILMHESCSIGWASWPTSSFSRATKPWRPSSMTFSRW